MKYRAILFDLDGTLLDTIEDLTDSMNVALLQLGFPPRRVSECEFFIGEGVEIFARRSLPESHRDEQTIVRCVELMRDDYVHRWIAKTRPYPGIAELLDGAAARGLAMAVLSNKPDDSTQKMVAHFFGNGRFKIVRGARPNVPRKPDPTSALKIAERLGLPPTKVLYLGDTGIDMITANAAGMYAVGALWGFRPAAELTENGAGMLIEDPTELLELI